MDAGTLAFALRYQGRKRVHNADEIMAVMVAKRLVEHLERSGFLVMKRANRGRRSAWARVRRLAVAAVPSPGIDPLLPFQTGPNERAGCDPLLPFKIAL